MGLWVKLMTAQKWNGAVGTADDCPETEKAMGKADDCSEMKRITSHVKSAEKLHAQNALEADPK